MSTDLDPGVDPDEVARAAVLDAFQQAWEQGDTLERWVARYPAYADDLAELALSLVRQQTAPPPPAAEVARAQRQLTQAMEAALGPPLAQDVGAEENPPNPGAERPPA